MISSVRSATSSRSDFSRRSGNSHSADAGPTSVAGHGLGSSRGGGNTAVAFPAAAGDLSVHSGGSVACSRLWFLVELFVEGPLEVTGESGAAAGTVAQRSRVVLIRPVSQPLLGSVALSPGGGLFYLCTLSSNRARTVGKIAEYTTATGALQRVIATLTGNPMSPTCQMALDPTGRLLTYSLSNRRDPAASVVHLARIDLTTRSVATPRHQVAPHEEEQPPAGAGTSRLGPERELGAPSGAPSSR
jgi:hypothetical protein